jgi:Caspase domain
MTLKSNQRIVGKGKTAVIQEQQMTKTPFVTEVTKVRNHLFVISINEYKFCPPLFNAVKDADDITRVLTTLYDFDPKNVVRLSNAEATESNILAQLKAYVGKLTNKDNLLVYYSGHGTYDALIEEGYWVPVDVSFRKESGDIDSSRCLANDIILRYLRAIKTLHTVVIADSCFSGSLATQRLVETGAARLETIPSRCILTAGRNEPVLDGKPGDNSPFASALSSYLEKNVHEGISFTALGTYVQKAVANNSTQIPICARLQNAGDQNGEFVFHRKQDENTFWADILRFNTIEGFKGYLAQYPQGAYVKEANQALTRLEKAIVAPNKGTDISIKQGTILYDVPNKMQLLQEVKCVIRIAFDEVMAKLDYKMTQDTELKTMRVSNVMNVDLLDASQQAFEIRAINAKQQFIDRDYFTQWLFFVKPLKEGNYTLLLKVTLIEEINGQERPREIVLEETVSIVANLPKPEASRMRAATQKIVMGPANESHPNPIHNPKNPKETPIHNNGDKNGIEILPAPEDVPPFKPLQEQVPLKLNLNSRKWLFGGGALAAVLAIFWVGKLFWKPLDNGIVAATDNTRGGIVNPVPTVEPTPLLKDTTTGIQNIQIPNRNSGSSQVKPVVKPVQPAKRAVPEYAQAKPKPKLPAEPARNTHADVDEEGLRPDPRTASLKVGAPETGRFSFREPPVDMKGVSKEDAEAWRKTLLNGEAEAYRKYMESQPNGAYKPYAKERWDVLREENDWHQVQNQKSWEGYHQHEQKYPQGRHFQEAVERKKAFEPQRNAPK